MKTAKLKLHSGCLMVWGTLFLLGGCSSTVVVKDTPLPQVPEYVKVPHPAGFDQADLNAIFFSPLAPKAVLGEFADTCDEEFKKLLTLTRSKDDQKKGALELVSQDPERMHWCFYAKISRLQQILQGNSTWTTRQKKVLEAFEFLSPVANAYLNIYHDSRYLRWASMYYTKISEWVFFKKVVPTPDNTLMLVNTEHSDLEPWVPVQNKAPMAKNGDSIFGKYGITLAPSIASTEDPLDETSNRAPASVEPATAPQIIPLVPTFNDPANAAPAPESVPTMPEPLLN